MKSCEHYEDAHASRGVKVRIYIYHSCFFDDC